MVANDLLVDGDGLYVAFTTLSFWQAYTDAVSARFRETNYEPEVFWTGPLGWRPAGADASSLTLGFSHESNGRGGTLSRSWNRLYARVNWERDNWALSVKPWWRIPEEDKEVGLGDENLTSMSSSATLSSTPLTAAAVTSGA